KLSTDRCGCAILAGQRRQQLRLARVGRRVDQYNVEAVRHEGERQSACADHPIHSRTQSSAYTAASPHSGPASVNPGNTGILPVSNARTPAHTWRQAGKPARQSDKMREGTPKSQA